MPICLNLSDVARQVGFKVVDKPTVAISGKLVVPLDLIYKECEISVALTITFNHQNIVTSATYEIRDTIYNFIEELDIEAFDKEINSLLKELCDRLGQSGQWID